MNEAKVQVEIRSKDIKIETKGLRRFETWCEWSMRKKIREDTALGADVVSLDEKMTGTRDKVESEGLKGEDDSRKSVRA